MAYTANKLKAKLAVTNYWHDPADATVATKIAWVPMSANFLATLIFGSGTGVVTFKIFAGTSSAGAGATEVVAHATPTTADAAGDTLVLECSAEQVKAALAGATHVSAEVDCGGAADIASVTYIRDGALAGGRFRYDTITTDVIS